MKPKEAFTKSIPLWIMIIGFIVSGLGGWYGGQLKTEKRFTDIVIEQAEQNNRITNNENCNKQTLIALGQTIETVRNFIVVYAAESGVVIEWKINPTP